MKKSLSPNLREFIDSPKVTDEYQERISELNNDKYSERWNEYKELILINLKMGKNLDQSLS